MLGADRQEMLLRVEEIAASGATLRKRGRITCRRRTAERIRVRLAAGIQTACLRGRTAAEGGRAWPRRAAVAAVEAEAVVAEAADGVRLRLRMEVEDDVSVANAVRGVNEFAEPAKRFERRQSNEHNNASRRGS